jgi:hypothetical protein
MVRFMNAAGQTVSESAYSLAAGSSQKIVTPGSGPVVTGSVRIVPAATSAPAAFAVFNYRNVAEAGVPALRGTAFRMAAESAAGIQTGLAIAAGDAGASVTLDLYRVDGTVAGLTTTFTLPPSGQVSKFLGEFFSNMPPTFQGLVRIRATSGEVSVIGLRGRTNERNDFLITTLPAAIENAASTATIFPHIVDGGGYTTQFILVGTGSGSLQFVKQDGTAFSLTIAP